MALPGPIFGVDAKSGNKVWEFLTVAGTPEAEKTWGNESWRTGGGGGWMPGTYDAETNTVWWGTANPAPLYDWSGSDRKTSGARPGDNLYTTSVIALDPDTGKLNSIIRSFRTMPGTSTAQSASSSQSTVTARSIMFIPTRAGSFSFTIAPTVRSRTIIR